MRQTFYVDIDEEIASVVDKLHKSLSEENYFVVNGRSLIAQSSVNFKLLKREADKMQKRIFVVTQDDQVVKMAQKSDIEIKNYVEGSEMEEFSQTEEKKEQSEISSEIEIEKENKLGSVGSDDFYGDLRVTGGFSDDRAEAEQKNETVLEIKREPTEHTIKTINRTAVSPKKSLSDLRVVSRGQGSSVSSDVKRKVSPTDISRQSSGGGYDLKKSFEDFLDPEKEKRFERILSHQQKPVEIEKPKNIKEKRKSGGGFLFGLSLFVIFVLAGVAGYLYVPSADVIIYLENEDKKITLDTEADFSKAEADSQGGGMPARIIEKEDSLMLSYDSTGVSESSGQKAKGNIAVYNSYSISPQPLVATTRFETEDGKIFRLIKGVTVPGMTSIGGESKPGVIEVEVMADEAGSSYNVGPSSFSIPGFKGGDKYEKIYAKSSKSMTGGGVSGDEVKTVSQADIDSAKARTEDLLKEKMASIIKTEISGDERVLPEASKLEISESLAIASVGDVKERFDYQAKAKVKFVVFRESEIKQIIEEKYRKENKKDFEVNIESIEVSYEISEADFESGKLKLRIFGQVSAIPFFDEKVFKANIASKDEEGIRKLMDDYPYVKNLEISVSPNFMSSRLPFLKDRINVETRKFE